MKNLFFCLISYLLLFTAVSCLSDKNIDKAVTKQQVVLGTSSEIPYLLDESLTNSNKLLANTNVLIFATIDQRAGEKSQYIPLSQKAIAIQKLTKEFNTYIDEIRDELVYVSGGFYSIEEAMESGNLRLQYKPKNGQDRETPNRIFVIGEIPTGQKIASKVLELKKNYIKTIESLWDNGGILGTVFANSYEKEEQLAKLEKALDFLEADTNYSPDKHEGKSWSEYIFGDKSVAEIYPLLRKFQNDAYASETTLLNLMVESTGKPELVYDKFDVLSQSSSSSILLGETYETEIALGAYSSQARFSVSVNGSRLAIKDGKAKYTAKPATVGEKSYTARISIMNPLTGETETFSKNFSYQVSQPPINVSLDKMNVFFVGVDNPLTVLTPGISTNDMMISITGGSLRKSGYNSYNVKVFKPGQVTVTIKNKKDGKSYPFEFRAKRIPDPTVKLGRKVDGLIGIEELKAHRGLLPTLENFDFEARCQIESYTLYHTSLDQATVELRGTSARFEENILAEIQKAKTGDMYAFTNVKARCPGDNAARRVNGLSFKIK